jgi:hypothetical protein
VFAHGLFYFFEEKPAKSRKRGLSKNMRAQDKRLKGKND